MCLAIPFSQKEIENITTLCVENGFSLAIGVDKCELSILQIAKRDVVLNLKKHLVFCNSQ